MHGRFFTVVIVYVVCGVLFMKYKKGASGRELIPNYTFWSTLPVLIKVTPAPKTGHFSRVV